MFFIIYLLLLGFFFILVPAIGFFVGKFKKRPWIGLIAGICLGWLGWEFFKMVMRRGIGPSGSSGLSAVLGNLLVIALVCLIIGGFFLLIRALTQGGFGKAANFVRGKNQNFDSYQPQDLYFTWRNLKDGIAIDRLGKKIYLSKLGRGKWFSIDEIKRFGFQERGFMGDFYVLTHDIHYPEFLWQVPAGFGSYNYKTFERAMQVTGNFGTTG